MLHNKHQLKIKELRSKISKKPEIVDKIKTIEDIGKKYKVDVLLIDDDPSGNFLYTKFLESSSEVNNITSMTCPIKSFEHLSNLHKSGKSFPKLILLDICMPFMDGKQFLEKFKKDFPRKKTKIILFTASKQEEIKEELKFNRVIGYLPKPLDMKKFEIIIKNNFS
jgi:two-component system, chemotaxis family, chemotaxis protein CheY